MASAPADVSPYVSTETATLAELRAELDQHRRSWEQQPPTPADLQQTFAAFRVQVAHSFEQLLGQKHRTQDEDVATAVELLFDLADAGGNDYPVAETMLAEAAAASTATGRFLRTVALVPGWQAEGQRLSDAPNWLLPVCAAYHFSGTRLLTTEGQAEACTRNYIQAVRDLAKLAELNRGSGAVRAALECYKRGGPPLPSWAGTLWTEVDVQRTRLTSALAARPVRDEPLLIPREGRRLRVGLVAEFLAPHGAVASALPLVERLDPTRFELVVLSADLESPAALQLKNRGADLVSLGATSADALQAVQDALLDAVVFVADPSQPEHLMHELARNRIAALQIWHDGLQEPCGAPEIDLFLCGSNELAPHYRGVKPRAALLPGIGTFERNELTTEGGTDATRAEVGLADEDFVLVSFAPLAAISPETKVCWAKILKRVPNAKLLLCAGSGETPDALWLHRFCTHFDRVLAENGAAAHQLLVFPDVFASYEARKRVLAIADVLLDAFTHSDAEAALAAAERGVPTVAMAAGPRRTQRAAGLLAMAELAELASASAAAYIPTVVRLATDAEWREDVKKRWATSSPILAAHHDSFALSEAFAWDLEHAFDEIVADRAAFVANHTAVSLPPPDEAELALSDARVLLEAGAFD